MSDKTNPAWDQIEATRSHRLQFGPKTGPVSAGNNVEFFGTPAPRGNVTHMEKDLQKQIGLRWKPESAPVYHDRGKRTS